jgi:predicted nucleic acid-binding protein
MRKIYLDTNILVSLVAEKKGDNDLTKRRAVTVNALNILSDSGAFTLCVSSWALTVMVKVMINEYGMVPKKVATIHNAITNTLSVNGFEIKIIGVSLSKRYSCEDLFLNVREIMTNYSPGWGDAFHCAIMRQNKIETILSADEKKDFQIIPGLKLLHPKKVKK